MRLNCAALLLAAMLGLFCAAEETGAHTYLYVAEPGIRNDLKYGGHGLLVFDCAQNYKFVKRIPTGGLDKKGAPINVKGICASKELHCVFISTIEAMMCVDLESEKVLWDKKYEGGCDRMSIAPESKFIYLPTFEKDDWHVVDPKTGDVIATVTPKTGAHNTVISLDGKHAFLGGLKSPKMHIADCSTHTLSSTIAFSDMVRPFVINGKGTTAYCCVNNLLGFEIGDVATGKMLHRVEVPGFKKGPVARHGCPSHGVGLSPDEKECWVADAFNKRVHIFDNTATPPKYVESIETRDEPGWVTFSIDGARVYPSSGEVIDAKTHKILTVLTDEEGRAVGSEKLLEVEMTGGKVTRCGDQFAFGRVTR